MNKNTCSIGLGKLRKLSMAYLQDVLLNLYNVKVKMESSKKSFQSDEELPTTRATDMQGAKSHICKRLRLIFPTQAKKSDEFEEICENIMESKCVRDMMEQLEKTGEEAMGVVKAWGVENALYVGIIPMTAGPNVKAMFDATADVERDRLYLHWDNSLSDNLIAAVTQLAQLLRNEGRQPTPMEYLSFHLAYYGISNGEVVQQDNARCLGTPGFRPYTQTYMSLTDPGDGHMIGTTKSNDWMKGAIVHVEHLERPRHLPREKIESYRIPSILDFSKVRLHVGTQAPTTYFVGRRVKDSGNFSEDFLKLVNITAASATAAFYQGAAECKVSMEGLSTSQAVQYMQALRGQVQRNRKQFLSAAWNLNQVITDDFEQGETKMLKDRMSIALRAIDITYQGGFNKITWDGASDTYPSKCIMYQFTVPEALTVVHEAHMRGLVTYFSAGFKFNEIKLAVYAGVDGIGIGGAQVLRFMDSQTGMHGPYMEENIPKILKSRDEASKSVQGRAVHILARLDTMYFEGSISSDQDRLRRELFTELLNENFTRTEYLLQLLKPVSKMADEGNSPLLGLAKRLIDAASPVLKDHFESNDEWNSFIKDLKSMYLSKDENSLVDEYESDPWLCARKRYRESQNADKRRFTRQSSYDIHCKCFN
ncbi:uncharacterized protein LOC110445682 [Mizuhopecten yessoensis]|uniref:Uncharacterized protein n=1 Tax=Mizuhopecten yessoensis TaxID=6573 RepID=A0A210QZD2_MIZYE|nr:uncharacterized protein LOC110445682 [Mizuhopecten yessoensis]OWF54106.1 hypothetical protein KP79_PYT15210 [Mizuhopecten yessoensis]